MADVYLGLGANLGDKRAQLLEALRRIAAFAEIRAASPFIETDPVGYLDQDRFLNAAAHVTTSLEPREFLARVLAVELAMGRVRTVPNGPRTIDLDILIWDGLILDEPGLVVPHPRMHQRRFVLEPLANIAPALVHPVFHRTIQDLLDALPPPTPPPVLPE